MASDIGFVEYVCEQVAGAGRITHRRMFGEFALYCDGKVVALICDNQFFLKPTVAGRALLERVKEAPPYPGAKMYYLLDADLEDAEHMARVVRATAAELPMPKEPAARKTAAKKTAAKKSAAKKTAAKKTGATKKNAAKETTSKKKKAAK
jgi:TfoX/Sxy family transcriptional regulator of competence genes